MTTPLFPLGTVLFPGDALPLVVFEERYKVMMAAVLATPDRSFAVAAIRQGVEVGGYAETYDMATIAAIEQVRRNEDGTMALVARGTARALIVGRPPDDPYPRAELEPVPDVPGSGAQDALASARRALNRYLKALAEATRRPVDAPTVPDDVVRASYRIAAALAVELPVRQRLLEAPSAADRLRMAADEARREAAILGAVGAPAGRLGVTFSSN